jgi:UDP-3-O-[3-hydroxymyristoyl] N-acetylglucosamine deacetylase
MSQANHRLLRPTRLLRGPCLHRAIHTAVQIHPAPRGAGINFLRRDLSPERIVPATLASARPCARRSEIHHTGASVSTVEHLLSALWALGLHDVQVWIDGPEVPLLDGSAAVFVHELLRAGLAPSRGPRATWQIRGGSSYRRGARECHLLPHQGLQIECSVSFPNPAIGRQFIRFAAPPLALAGRYTTRVAPARTFGSLSEASELRRGGLAQGASLRNVLVFDATRAVNGGGTRFADEPVRHKLLDSMGDLALLGGPLQGRIKLRRCSHAHLQEALRRAVADGVMVQLHS